MKIGIQNNPRGFAKNWIEYCKENNISYKLINPYANDVVKQLKDCDIFMWHYNPHWQKDYLHAKNLLFTIEHIDKIVFPSFYENWHYNDKLAQKYLLEAVEAPLVKTYIFYNKKEALSWIEYAKFPKIFKLSVGASSMNVKMCKSKQEAIKLTKRAFKKGFQSLSRGFYFKESYRKYKKGDRSLLSLFKSAYRYLFPHTSFYLAHNNKEKGYVYFQDFIPNNKGDYRIVVLNNKKAFGVKRFNRENDFRASDSGNSEYLTPQNIPDLVIQIAFETAKKLKMNSIAYDFVLDANNNPLILEISYAFSDGFDSNIPGYWDEQCQWHEEKLGKIPSLMIEEVIRKYQKNNEN